MANGLQVEDEEDTYTKEKFKRVQKVLQEIRYSESTDDF